MSSTVPSGILNFDLSGKLALVTGSSQGIGLELARGLAKAGATVVIHGRDEKKAAAAAKAVEDEAGIPVHFTTFDITDPKAVDAGIGLIEEQWGVPDVVVNNAGIQRRNPIPEFKTEDYEDLVATNLSGTFYVARRISQGMIDRGSGKLIQIGSVQSLLGRPSIAAYAATKGAVSMLTKGLCADLGPYGIQANAIAPGYFATELTQPLVDDPEFSAWVEGRTPAGRWGDTADLVGAAVFFASSASDFVNGQTLYVDGGMTSVV